jgi:hypothetical protein
MTATRFCLFSLFFSSLAILPAQKLKIQTGLTHEGQDSIRIQSKSATWIYHTEGAGFASLYDRDGKDWISYHPGNRSAGEFRGIPNLGVVAHPGYEGNRGAKTRVVRNEAIFARLQSETNDGKWLTQWDFHPGFARLTILRAGEPYWFLYEGTPAGKLDLDTGFWGLPDGIRRSYRDIWNADIEGAEWVYFGDTKSKRVLFVINHQDDQANDQFWQMESNMTVWGFGRQYRCCGRYMTAVPAQFTVGFVESTKFNNIRKAVEKARRAH